VRLTPAIGLANNRVIVRSAKYATRSIEAGLPVS
jgi:hypothetical protein